MVNPLGDLYRAVPSAALVTDWSSIATDFFALARPAISLAAAPPSATLGLVELTRAVESVIDDPSGYVARFEVARQRSVMRAWGDTLYGLSASRYLAAIETLEEQRRTR